MWTVASASEHQGAGPRGLGAIPGRLPLSPEPIQPLVVSLALRGAPPWWGAPLVSRVSVRGQVEERPSGF